MIEELKSKTIEEQLEIINNKELLKQLMKEVNVKSFEEYLFELNKKSNEKLEEKVNILKNNMFEIIKNNDNLIPYIVLFDEDYAKQLSPEQIKKAIYNIYSKNVIEKLTQSQLEDYVSILSDISKDLNITIDEDLMMNNLIESMKNDRKFLEYIAEHNSDVIIELYDHIKDLLDKEIISKIIESEMKERRIEIFDKFDSKQIREHFNEIKNAIEKDKYFVSSYSSDDMKSNVDLVLLSLRRYPNLLGDISEKTFLQIPKEQIENAIKNGLNFYESTPSIIKDNPNYVSLAMEYIEKNPKNYYDINSLVNNLSEKGLTLENFEKACNMGYSFSLSSEYNKGTPKFIVENPKYLSILLNNTKNNYSFRELFDYVNKTLTQETFTLDMFKLLLKNEKYIDSYLEKAPHFIYENPAYMKEILSESIYYLKYIPNEYLTPDLLNSNIGKVIEKGIIQESSIYNLEYILNKDAIRNNPHYISLILDKSNDYYFIKKIVNGLNEKGLSFENFKKAIEKGYIINEKSPKEIRNYKYIKYALEKGQNNALNYLVITTLPKELEEQIFKALEEGQIDILNVLNFNLLTKEQIEKIEKIIYQMLNNGYKIYSSSPSILKQYKYIKYAVEKGQTDSLNYLYINNITEEEKQELEGLIYKAIDNGYQINNYSPIILNQYKYIKYAIEKGQGNALEYFNMEKLTEEEKPNLEETIYKAIDNGYQIYYYSPIILKQYKYIKYAIEKGQYNALDFLDINSVPEEKKLEELIYIAMKKGYIINYSSLYTIKYYFFKTALINGKFDILNQIKEIVNFEKINKENIFNNNELITLFNNIINTKNYNNEFIYLYLFILKKYSLSDFKDENLDKYQEYILSNIKNELTKKFKNEELVNTYISKLLENNFLNPLNFTYINNIKDLKFVTNYNFDLKSIEAQENNYGITEEILNKGNTKQIKKIIELLKNIPVSDSLIPLLSINIYMSIGYTRALDLLSNKYGTVDEEKLKIFINIIPSNTLFEKDGNGYKPQINEQLINIVFGTNYNISNTPIRNFLNNYSDKQLEIQKQKEKINNDMTLTIDEKKQLIKKIDEQYEKYKKELNDFFANIANAFSEWDIVEEEFLKSTTKSSLKLKLNLSKINEIVKIIKLKRKVPNLDIEDEQLAQSDVFEYAFSDTQFVSNINKVPSRIIELSRRMDNVKTKKFPNIELQSDNYKIRTYGPQERRLLSAGYRSHCCFRACGNADDSGKDTSLLNYCTSTDYGGGVEILDEKGKTIMFSPLLRNGNVLMIHSVETQLQQNLPEECYKLLVEYSKKIIEQAKQQGDDISFVTITNLHYLDITFTEGSLPLEKKFSIYDEQQSFNGMYTNLECNHMILAHKQEKTFEDITYGKVETNYEYPLPKVYGLVQISEQEKEYIKELDELKSEYTKLANNRKNALEQGNEQEAYELLEKIKEKKNHYLQKYKELVKLNSSSDIYLDYSKSLKYVERINNQLGLETKNETISEIVYSSDWYIIITSEKEIIANALESGKKDLIEQLNKIKNTRNISVVNGNINELEEINT